MTQPLNLKRADFLVSKFAFKLLQLVRPIPNGPAQSRVIAEAIARAGADTRDVAKVGLYKLSPVAP